MTKQTINLGNAPNDGAGDDLRTAFAKANSNFDELYALQRPQRPGIWYPLLPSDGTNGLNNQANSILWTPMLLTRPTAIDGLAIRVSSASANGALRMYVYAAGADGTPTGSCLINSGDISAAVAQVVSASFPAFALGTGLYWFGVHYGDSSISVASAGWGGTAAWIVGVDSVGFANGCYGLRTSQDFATGTPVNPGTIYYGGPGINRQPQGYYRVAA